jgi:hypothetical protein
MSGIKEILFELMEQDHERAVQLRAGEEELTFEEAKHQRSAERAGQEAYD